MRDKPRGGRRLRLHRETLAPLTRPELDTIAGGAQRPWLSAWTCRSCPDVSCGCPR